MHLYDKAGKPVYEVPYADPKKGMRKANLRDARKLDLVPSVTEIQKVQAKPQLEKWKIDQAILSALTLPRFEGESEGKFIGRLHQDRKALAQKAAEVGNEIHDAVEKVFKGQVPGKKWRDVANSVLVEVIDHFGVREGWIAEQSFACKEGYGGKIDLIHLGEKIVVDFKTKEILKPKMAYTNHVVQAAGYGNGVGFKRFHASNFFISWEGEVVVHPWQWTELEHGLSLFRAMLQLWKVDKKFDPSWR